MSLDAATAQELINKLNADRDHYLESVNRTTELLLQAIAASGGINPSFSRLTDQKLNSDTLRRNTLPVLDVENVQSFHGTNSTYSGEEDSGSEDASSLYIDNPLLPEEYHIDGLRDHIRKYDWTQAGRRILDGVIGNEQLLKRPELFPIDLETSDDRSHLSHGSIFDVGKDGIPYTPMPGRKRMSNALGIWNRLRTVNTPAADESAVGKVVIVREPSPLLFAALHYTMNKHFDMDEVFGFLIDHDPVLARPHNPFSGDHRRRRTFVFNMEYFTLIGTSGVFVILI